MIGIDRRTGRTISGVDQLASRLLQVFSTQLASRYRRRQFGSNCPKLLAELTNQGMLLQLKGAMFDAMLNPSNGVLDFNATQIQFQVDGGEVHAHINGKWKGSDITVRVPFND